MADSLQDLFNLSKEPYLSMSKVGEQERMVRLTVMVDGHGQLDDSEVTRTLGHVLFAGGTFEIAINSTQMRIVQTFFSRSKTRFILQFYDVRNMLQVTPLQSPWSGTDHSLRIFNGDDSHSINLLFREETKLDLLDGAQFRARMREVEIRHV